MPHDVIVVGAGVIGLSIAWRCAQRGLDVVVFDPSPGDGASGAAAGMLAPVTELHFEGRDLLQLNVASAARYPEFAAELGDVTGLDVGYRRSGTVQVAWDAADLAGLRQLHEFHSSLGVTSAMLSSRELRAAEPALAAGLPGGLWAPDDHQVDNRKLHAALMVAAEKSSVMIVARRVVELLVHDGMTVGVQTAPIDTSGPESFHAPTVVLAAGAWSRQIAGIPSDALPPVRPVKGQTLRLRTAPDLLTHVVRGNVKGNPVYVVPRGDGDLVVGASSDESGFDTRPRAGAVYELLRDAATLVPELGEAEFVEVSTSLRPGSPDNAPLIGRSALPGLVMATGHYRNGILLTPVTADEVAELIISGVASALIAPFTPERFTRNPGDPHLGVARADHG